MNITRDSAREVHTHSRSIAFEGHEPEEYNGFSHNGKLWIPAQAYAEWQHGKPIQQITVQGNILKKDGTPGQSRGRQRYATPASRSWDTPFGTNAPEWLLELFADSVHTAPSTMMAEGEVRSLLNVLKGNLDKATNPTQAIAFSGGVSALDMVLEGEG
jgi:hypothetical protein